MLKVGLTGGIGSGKTAVSDLFASKGVPVIDTDVITRELLENDSNTKQQIVTAFSNVVLNENQKIDRKVLASIVFGNTENKKRLENILHPLIRQRTLEQIQTLENNAQNHLYIIVVVPLLFETGFNQLVDRSLAVIADEERRIERVAQRDNRKLVEIQAIISSQVSDNARREKADDILENNNDISQLEPQVAAFHKKYQDLARTGRQEQ